ncbi:DNA recombination protein RmuC [Candidatus Kinetoplastibacterium blastocrithidii TCC012E]|uniref:DNA recombination protein RmuC n=1 Tax=Candidatus Kinetoplastidibacterium blastocrithidiae TCC012E TaxID=1208922 RepID=M1M381_9PROT|nr:DNA recombination protein RmuC [Candidatus Kinetoplastibacterium blastocrithidii]AGF49629.1 DNA recombination protein RmuC [Candidatus Kinetoplastibacterium blastocrithidii TCC012E]
MTINCILLYLLFLLILFNCLVIIRIWVKLKHSSFEKVTDIIYELSNFERRLHDDIIESHRLYRNDILELVRIFQVDFKSLQDSMRDVLSSDARSNRLETTSSFMKFSDNFTEKLQGLIEINDRRTKEIRQTLEYRLQILQNSNSEKLDEIRYTVDEKLHSTLEKRLGESFKQVSERLEAVHQGLGEMQNLAVGVGDLKRVLNNVKTRGTWGEIQLSRLIEDIMTPDQYGRNVKIIPNKDSFVEFAIKLPGSSKDSSPIWLPIDSKFPKEEYERLIDANDSSNLDIAKAASNALAKAIELQARAIALKYIEPPYTTEFAIMFLPTEGLYAEVLRYPGLFDRLFNLHINVVGPSNLAALLNSLQIGFKTLAIEKRSSEVWNILRAVKTEFSKFGESLASVKKTLDTASNKIGQTEVRSRAMLNNLKSLEVLSDNDDTAELSEDLHIG